MSSKVLHTASRPLGGRVPVAHDPSAVAPLPPVSLVKVVQHAEAVPHFVGHHHRGLGRTPPPLVDGGLVAVSPGRLAHTGSECDAF